MSTKIEREGFYIISGGPGSGKSTIIEELKKQGCLCIDEVARQIIEEQIQIGGDAQHTMNQKKFCDLMLSRSIYTYKQTPEDRWPVFFDRGIPELIGYCYLTKIIIPNYLREAVKLFRYNQTVFITPPWQDIYQHDELRKQSWKEAVKTYQCICQSYQEAGYSLLEIPKVSVNERVSFILSHCQKQ